MTACRRPEIVGRTLSSFASAMGNYNDHRLIVNIDPVGGTFDDSTKIREICKTFFKELLSGVGKKLNQISFLCLKTTGNLLKI